MFDLMMSQTTLLKSFWDYALETTARILNMVPTKKVEKTPYEVWHGVRQGYAFYGSYVFIHHADRNMEFSAMNVEMQSMKDNEVWILAELPPNGKTVGSKWLFKKKTDMDGAVIFTVPIVKNIQKYIRNTKGHVSSLQRVPSNAFTLLHLQKAEVHASFEALRKPIGGAIAIANESGTTKGAKDIFRAQSSLTSAKLLNC
ncbi:hypothetical protein Tco_1575237 [Tanacetum coccineum]